MFKKIVLGLLAFLLVGYMVFVVFFMNKSTGQSICQELEVSVLDTLDRNFINEKGIATELKNAGLSPIGKKTQDIHTGVIEKKLMENKLIKRVECYKTSSGNVKIEIFQKLPILRIFSTSGSYYIDNEGEVMPVPDGFSTYVPIASGYVDKELAKTKLYQFALFLSNDKFWNNQIEQIYVNPNQEVELTPRVGKHQIILGKLDLFRENLDKLKVFYEKGLNQIGWNRYSQINLKFKDQVVCTKGQSE